MPLRHCETDGLPALRFGRTGKPVPYGHGTGRTLQQAAREAASWGKRRAEHRLQARPRIVVPGRADAKIAPRPSAYHGRVSIFSDRVTSAHNELLQSQARLARDAFFTLAGPLLAAMEQREDGYRADADEWFQLLDLLRILRPVIAATAQTVREGLRFLGGETDQDVTDTVDDELSRLLNVPLATAAGSNALVEAWIGENVALITSITDTSLSEVEALVADAMRSGTPTRKLREQIEQRFEVSYSRANLIARDQTAKLASNIAQARHLQYGIDRYQWSTSGDARVRQSHASLDGRIFTYAEGAPGGIHPGTEFQCRCVAAPVFDDEDAARLQAEAAARQEQELLWFTTESPTVQGSIPNYSGFSDWNKKRIRQLREGSREAVGLAA